MEIIFDHSELIAVNKPNGLLVHRTSIAADAKEFALQKVRDMIQSQVYPVHRLDRKTSGVLLFAKNKQMQKSLNQKFANHEIVKKYVAIVRGFVNGQFIIDHPVTNDRGKLQDAITMVETLEQTEIHVALGEFETSRYSLLAIEPKTGRMHQIRKHMAHVYHPIIGDRPHGCNKQNRMFKHRWGMMDMLLHARQLSFTLEGERFLLEAPIPTEFKRMMSVLAFDTKIE